MAPLHLRDHPRPMFSKHWPAMAPDWLVPVLRGALALGLMFAALLLAYGLVALA